MNKRKKGRTSVITVSMVLAFVAAMVIGVIATDGIDGRYVLAEDVWEAEETNDYEQILNELEESMKELENQEDVPEENPTVETEQESNRYGLTDEERLLGSQSESFGSPPHGYEKDAWSSDKMKVYYEAGGNLLQPLRSHLARYISIWAQKKEEEEGEEYWTDNHIIRPVSEAALNSNLLGNLNPSSILCYTREVMESSIWEELRAYVGDEEADRIDQDMYELIQKEEEILVKME